MTETATHHTHYVAQLQLWDGFILPMALCDEWTEDQARAAFDNQTEYGDEAYRGRLLVRRDETCPGTAGHVCTYTVLARWVKSLPAEPEEW